MALIDLCVDICKRNGIKELKWKADKSLIGQVDKQNMTVHRWFANKDCPGDYLYNRHGEIAKVVNARLGNVPFTPDKPTGGVTVGGGSVTPTDDVDKQIWAFLTGKGLSTCAVAGIMGNLYAESGLRPDNLQNTYEKSLGMTDAQYTAAVDKGVYNNFVRDSAGYGLAQWTYWSRKQALLAFAKAAGASIGDLSMQLNFLWKELQGYANVMKVLKSAKTVKEASDVILLDYERPANQSEVVKAKRAGYEQTYYDKFAGQAPASKFPNVPFLVKVIVSGLNYRSTPSMSGTVKGQTGKGVFTITEVKNGWGKLKSGVGWIYLENPSYCTILK